MRTNAARFAQKLGARIATLRKDRDQAQGDLATRAGVNKGYLSSIESGQRTPSLGVLVRLAAALRVGMADLFPDAPPASARRVGRTRKAEPRAARG